MRTARIALLAAGALVAILLLGAVALLLLVDPNRYRGDIQRIASQHLGRQLTLEGKLELKIFPWLAISVHDVRLSNPPGFGAEPFATVRTASIGVKLLPLLGKRLQVSRIAIEGLTVSLASRGETNNWQDLGQRGSGTTPSSHPTSTTSTSIGAVRIADSTFVLRDEVKKSTREVVIKELRVGQLSNSPSGFQVQEVKLEGTYRSLIDSSVKSESVKPLPFSLKTAGVTLDTRVQALAPTTISVNAGELAIILTAAGEKLSSDRMVHGTVTVPTMSARHLLQALDIAPPVTRDPGVLSAFSLKTNYRLTRKQLSLLDLDLALDDTRVQGAAAIDDLDSDASSFDLKVNGINIDRYRAPVVTATATAKTPQKAASERAATPLPLETIRKLDTHGTLRVGSATFAGVAFTDITMPLAAKDGRVRLGPTQARLYGGGYSGDILLDAHQAQAQLSLNEHIRATDMGALMKAAFDSARVSGHADAEVAVTGVGNTDKALIHSLRGKVDAIVKQGALNGIDIGYELQRAASLLKQQVPPQRTGPERTVFNSLQASSTIDHGVLKNDDLRIETDFLKVHGRGTLDLTTEAIDYRIAASVDQASALAARNGLDALRGTEVPLVVTRTVSNPTVRPDLEALAKGQLGQEAKRKGADLLKKKLGDLFGH